MPARKRATKKETQLSSLKKKPAKKSSAKKKPAKKSSAKKTIRIVEPPHPFLTCIDRCYANLKLCLERNPNNAPMCLKKFTACVVGCIGPVFRP